MAAEQLFSESLALSNATVTTTPRFVAGFSVVSFFVNSTGTASGAWTWECSNDGLNWTTYTLTTTPPAAPGSGQTFGVSVQFYEYAYSRLKFSGSGGTGTATVTTTIKAG